MSKVAIITYHSAYNYGSVLQAFATQETLKRLGIKTDIINYRIVEQKNYYEKLLRTKYGTAEFLSDLTMLFVITKKIKRKNSFEIFYSNNYSLTRKCTEPDEVYEIWRKYDLIISGSDQIWNKHSIELSHANWRYMEPYLLKGFPGKKISYASCINDMKKEELDRILPEINSFQALSFREKESAYLISGMLDREVTNVLDPTFLLTKKEWVEKMHLLKYSKKDSYILCYCLKGSKTVAKLVRYLRELVKKTNYRVILVTPFAYVPTFDSKIINHTEYGPREFLEALYNAESVITDSYHGTVLSINFEKPFYSLTRNGEIDLRRRDILERFSLVDYVGNMEEISKYEFPPIDNQFLHGKLLALRKQSIEYLKNAVKM